MHVRTTGPELLTTMDHPAWSRFSSTLTGSESTLLIEARAGLGHEWFARSWPDARIVSVRDDADQRPTPGVDTVDSLAAAFDKAAGGAQRLAVILDSPTVDWTVLADHDWRMARASDLLLSVDEVDALATSTASVRAPPATTAEPISGEPAHLHRLTGGWLEPTLILLLDPQALTRAKEAMLPSLSRWIVQHHHGWEVAKAAFLEPITADTLAAFFREIHGSPPSIADMRAAGFLVLDEDGTVFMPDLIRHCLTALVHQNDRALADDLVAVAIDAVAESVNVTSAVQHAVSRRHWHALGDLLSERWTDLFTSDARIIRRLFESLPTSVIDQWLGEFGGAAVRLLKGAGPDGMSFMLPDGRLEHEKDTLALRLQAKTTSLYRDPGPAALSFGLLEVGYLRLAGHDAQAAVAARRLLTALHSAESQRRIRPALASVVNLHSGVPLAIGGDPVLAYSSYRAAYHQVAGSDHHFLLSDTTSKLALLTALRGDTHEAREWITAHDRWIGEVGWGRKMVGRSAHLARALVALADLDLNAMDTALRVLPATPDQDETWQVHAYLLAMRSLVAGQPRRALIITSSMRHQRPHPSQTPLAQHLFAIADRAAEVSNPLGAPAIEPASATPHAPELRLLDAYRALLIGDVDHAAALVGRARTDVLGTRWLNVAMQLHIVMDRQDKSDMVEYLVEDVVSGQGALVDLALLQRHAVLSDSHLQRLSDAQRARLSRIPPIPTLERPRPTLTPRELEVLDGLRQGLTRRQIAERQFRSENTVRSQVRSLYQKLSAGTLDEALAAARRWGL
ncbi:helix-turn-helix transcriptional regulator [Brevibacterium jeotgali]|uniref:Regulatory protein, luxR family n=1 Tax=Brevibacterium jeotgali TaxID=1262550 RepID=A0A2H1L7X7_9MICO|nr:LuxR C-terminal-related transcriptional regulator [Brevibacterium jeotgali]TWC03336.1 regulatory LuxR family protein [Brevibacterium jeotgali]SMY12996.1 regulatory protein, luxR family [Brevibacterium jeotgali]